MNKMSKFDSYAAFLAWFMILMLGALVAGCGSSGDDSTPIVAPAATTKALTAYSFVGFPGAAGTIDEAAKTIAVTLPNGTAVTLWPRPRSLWTTTQSLSRPRKADGIGSRAGRFIVPPMYAIAQNLLRRRGILDAVYMWAE